MHLVCTLGMHNRVYTYSLHSVKVVKVDFGNHQALVDALKGQDAVVLTLGDLPNLFKNSKIIIDAAIEAGVKRVLPSEYGK